MRKKLRLHKVQYYLRKYHKQIFIGEITLAVLVLLVGVIYLFFNYNKKQVLGALDNVQLSSSSDLAAQKELQEAVAVTGTFGEGKEPVYFGKIRDLDTLKKKAPFFKKAKVGDILIIYPEMTIIFDPKTKVVVDTSRTNLLK